MIKKICFWTYFSKLLHFWNNIEIATCCLQSPVPVIWIVRYFLYLIAHSTKCSANWLFYNLWFKQQFLRTWLKCLSLSFIEHHHIQRFAGNEFSWHLHTDNSVIWKIKKADVLIRFIIMLTNKISHVIRWPPPKTGV